MEKSTFLIIENGEVERKIYTVIADFWEDALIQLYDEEMRKYKKEFSFVKMEGIIVNYDTDEHRNFTVKIDREFGIVYKLGLITKRKDSADVMFHVDEKGKSALYYRKASSFQDALEKIYEASMLMVKKSSSEVEKHGFITNSVTGEWRTYKVSVKNILGEYTIVYDLGLEKEKKKVGKSHVEEKTPEWFNDVFIPKKLMDTLNFNPKRDFTHSSGFNSFFTLECRGTSARHFMFNPKTRQLLLFSQLLNSELFNEYVVERSKNPIVDFVTGYFTFNAIFDNGRITFLPYRSTHMRNKEISDEIVEVIKMFRSNGANDKTIISFEDTLNDYTLKYFLKAKVIW